MLRQKPEQMRPEHLSRRRIHCRAVAPTHMPPSANYRELIPRRRHAQGAEVVERHLPRDTTTTTTTPATEEEDEDKDDDYHEEPKTKEEDDD